MINAFVSLLGCNTRTKYRYKAKSYIFTFKFEPSYKVDGDFICIVTKAMTSLDNNCFRVNSVEGKELILVSLLPVVSYSGRLLEETKPRCVQLFSFIKGNPPHFSDRTGLL